MAGLGEVCTHIAAVLFYLEAAYRIKGKETCTQTKCEWLLPSFLKKIEYKPVRHIDFTSTNSKKRKLDEMIDSSSTSKQQQSDNHPATSTEQKVYTNIPDEKEMSDFFESLNHCGTIPVVLSLVPNYSDKFVKCNELPRPLQLLHDPKFMTLEYEELLNECASLKILLTKNQAEKVEIETRNQAKSNLWFKFRAGRVTASKMKAVCHTDALNPSQSLVKRVCYPEAFCFKSKQTTWGCKHEKPARDRYFAKSTQVHAEFEVRDNGLFISNEWPYIGASPDGIINCTCCGTGVLEVKCPYSHQGERISECAASDKNFCLKYSSDNTLYLDQKHEYYYQVQTQLFVLDVDYCDFCVCTFTADEESDLYIERIVKNRKFWDDCILRAGLFFRTCILPELLGKWYTRARKASDNLSVVNPDIGSDIATIYGSDQSGPSSSTDIYCNCRAPADGKMIGCDNENCKIEWFHTKCLNLKTIPKGKWYCSACKKP